MPSCKKCGAKYKRKHRGRHRGWHGLLNTLQRIPGPPGPPGLKGDSGVPGFIPDGFWKPLVSEPSLKGPPWNIHWMDTTTYFVREDDDDS